MANVTKRGNTFRIKVSCGYDVSGKQVVKSTTYKPDPAKSDKWNEKELQRQAVLFEESCKQGQTTTAAKFETFARDWFAGYADIQLKKSTLGRYHRMSKRIFPAIGHIRVDKLSPIDVQRFIRAMVDEGLSPKTVKHHIRLVSVIMNYAVKKRVANYNPCVTADLPKMSKTVRDFFSVEEVKQMLELLRNEPDEKKPLAMLVMLAVYSGFRKGELMGLEWSDVDFDNDIVTVNRAFYYNSYYRLYYTDTPKTPTSNRSLKLPRHLMNTLAEYRKWQDKQREICGGSWVESDRVFTGLDGSHLSNGAPKQYIDSFCKRVGLRRVTLHSFRHFNASALIHSGVDVVTVQKALGHSTPTTTLDIYSHEFKTAKTRAMEAIASAIDL